MPGGLKVILVGVVIAAMFARAKGPWTSYSASPNFNEKVI
jgi:hypothetical protein